MRSYVSDFAAWVSAYPAVLRLETQKLTAGPGRTKGFCSYSCPAEDGGGIRGIFEGAQLKT